MREIQEYTAEVFRRSEKRIKERRRVRNRVLSLCIPLCLTVALCSVMLLPTLQPIGPDGAQEPPTADQPSQETAPENAVGGTGSFVSVIIKGSSVGSDGTQAITDPDQVTSIHRVVLNLYKETPTGTPDDSLDEDPMIPPGDTFEDYQNGASAGSPEYTIIFTSSDGANATYILKGYELYDVNNAVGIHLSDMQLQELKTVCGLTE